MCLCVLTCTVLLEVILHEFSGGERKPLIYFCLLANLLNQKRSLNDSIRLKSITHSAPTSLTYGWTYSNLSGRQEEFPGVCWSPAFFNEDVKRNKSEQDLLMLLVCLDLSFGEQHSTFVLSEHGFFQKRLSATFSDVFKWFKNVTVKIRLCWRAAYAWCRIN